MSGKSFVMAMTVANIVTKMVMNVIAGLQTKGNPIAARVACYTPKLSKKPRTQAMIINAGSAYCFKRKGGTE